MDLVRVRHRRRQVCRLVADDLHRHCFGSRRPACRARSRHAATQVDRTQLARSLPRQRQEAAHDPDAALGGATQAGQRVADDRVGGVLLEHHRAADHDRERVVQLVRDAGQQGAQGGHLLALVQCLALPRQLGLRLSPAGNVAQVGGEHPALVEPDLGDGQLDRQQPPRAGRSPSISIRRPSTCAFPEAR